MQNKRRERRENMKLMSNIPPPIPHIPTEKSQCVCIYIQSRIVKHFMHSPKKHCLIVKIHVKCLKIHVDESLCYYIH